MINGSGARRTTGLCYSPVDHLCTPPPLLMFSVSFFSHFLIVKLKKAFIAPYPMNRRHFFTRAGKTLTVLTILGASAILPSCGNDVEEKSPFAFLARAGDPEFLTISTGITHGKDLQAVVDHCVLISQDQPVSPSEVPEDLYQAMLAQHPENKITQITSTVLSRPEQKHTIAHSYLAYARDIISWMHTQPGFTHLPPLSLEFFCVGQQRQQHDRTPVSIDFFKLTLYKPHFATDTVSSPVTYYRFNPGGSSRGLVILVQSPDDPQSLQLQQNGFGITLSTWRENNVELLISPLSEYIPLLLREGIRTEFDTYQKRYGGKVPLTKGYHVTDNLIASMESVSEAAAAHCLLAYVAQDHIKKHLPPDIIQRIRTYITNGITSHGKTIYNHVPAAFAWMEEQGVPTVVNTYLTDSDAFKTHLLIYKDKKK